jgi:hypothetical protein
VSPIVLTTRLPNDIGYTLKFKGGGDIITIDTFDNFDLQFDWRIAPGGNSGVKYLVTEDRGGLVAHAYQVVDDARHPEVAFHNIRIRELPPS